MRKFIYIVLLSLLSGWAVAQPQLIIPTEDPFRTADNSTESSPNARTASFTVNVDDTLKLPFFEDFASPYVPTDSVHNESTAPVKLELTGLHGLQNGDSVYIYEVKPFPIIPSGPKQVFYHNLRDTFYVKVIDPFSFELFTDKALGITDSFPGSDSTLNYVKWSRIPYDSSLTTVLVFPDTLKWENNSNVYINDRYAISPPSYNVATFDGLDKTGVPYVNNVFYVTGYNDNLTSLPIKMEGNNIYMSFYWQKAGYGEVSNNGDFLAIEFKDNTNTWNEVMRIEGNAVTSVDVFNQETIAITDPKYLFNGFQFRFRNFGSRNGPFDIWNVDYIYIDSARTAIDTIYEDWTVSEMAETFLKNYSAMPYNQFFANKANEVLTSVPFKVGNLSKSNDLFTPSIRILDASLSLLYGPAIDDYNNETDLFLNFDMPLTDYTALVDTGGPQLIYTGYRVKMKDSADVWRAFNNYYQQPTVLWDYYAYDDGSAEYGFATKIQGSSVANRFIVNTTDTLTHVDICFTKQKGSNMNGRTIFLELRRSNFSLKHEQAIEISYSPRANGFVRFELDSGIRLVPGTYHIGYKQNFNDLLVTGYDANIDHSDMLYVNDGNSWEPFTSSLGHIPGSLMVRPVFYKGQWLDVPNVTPVADQLDENYDVVLYPNPSSGEMNLEGDIKQVTIYDLYGKIVFEQTVTLQEIPLYTFDVSSLSSGMYLVHVFGKKGSVVKKLIME